METISWNDEGQMDRRKISFGLGSDLIEVNVKKFYDDKRLLKSFVYPMKIDGQPLQINYRHDKSGRLIGARTVHKRIYYNFSNGHDANRQDKKKKESCSLYNFFYKMLLTVHFQRTLNVSMRGRRIAK